MASITKYTTKKGTFYRATIYAGIDPETGKQENITKRGFKTKKEANAWADKTRVALAMGVKLESKKRTKMTFSELYQEWFEQYRYTVKPSTAHKTEDLFRLHILPAFGSMNLQAIKTPMVQRQVNAWFHKYSKYKTMYNYTHRVLAYAVRRNYVKTNLLITSSYPDGKRRSKLITRSGPKANSIPFLQPAKKMSAKTSTHSSACLPTQVCDVAKFLLWNGRISKMAASPFARPSPPTSVAAQRSAPQNLTAQHAPSRWIPKRSMC